MEPLNVFLTGHRPAQKDKETGEWVSKLAWEGVDPFSEKILWRLVALYRAYFKKHRAKIKSVTSGMADGVDIAGAMAAIMEDIPVKAFIPYKDHNKGKSIYKEYYEYILLNAQEIHEETRPYFNGCLTKRNVDMINAGDTCLALWDGTWGGTAHCVTEAQKAGKPLMANLWPMWVKYRAVE